MDLMLRRQNIQLSLSIQKCDETNDINCYLREENGNETIKTPARLSVLRTSPRCYGRFERRKNQMSLLRQRTARHADIT